MRIWLGRDSYVDIGGGGDDGGVSNSRAIPTNPHTCSPLSQSLHPTPPSLSDVWALLFPVFTCARDNA